MQAKLMTCALILVVGLAGCGSPVGSAHAADAVVESVHCAFDYAPAKPCQLSDRVAPDGTHTMEFTSDTTRTRFVGKPQTAWWSGKLAGKPAMGYELNRGHVAFSTMDLKTTFEWWSDGNQHGSY